MQDVSDFPSGGWAVFPHQAEVAAWARAALPHARAAVSDPAMAHWLRCGGTWFVGVDALPNDANGSVEGGPPLEGAVMDVIRGGLGFALPLHRAQVSVCYPGYPQPSPEETPSAFAFRRNRDAAHVDGLLALGAERRRFLREPHAYILGLPLTDSSADASPLVVWEGSHRIMGQAFALAYADVPAERWSEVDVTAIYQAARREVFACCTRIALPLRPGEACLLHRHILHGVAPWGEGASAGPDGRMIAYFRPEFGNLRDWLDAP